MRNVTSKQFCFGCTSVVNPLATTWKLLVFFTLYSSTVHCSSWQILAAFAITECSKRSFANLA